MLMIATLYVVLAWLLFSKVNLVRWGWFSGSVAVFVGAFILAAFLAFFNYLMPVHGNFRQAQSRKNEEIGA